MATLKRESGGMTTVRTSDIFIVKAQVTAQLEDGPRGTVRAKTRQIDIKHRVRALGLKAELA